MPKSPETRKAASIAKLQARGVPCLDSLPVIEYEAYWTLLWALGIVATLDYPNHTIDCDFAMHAVARCTP